MGANDGGAGDGGTFSSPSIEHTSGYGLTMTLVGAVLLALAYYGVVAIGDTHAIGDALPAPFYGLVIAFLFVIELLQRGRLDFLTLARAIALTAVYGALFVFAVEGALYLWENPEVALDGYIGVTVLTVSLLVAAFVYVGYLTVIDAESS